ncbi:MAG: efflux RND transporter periplasmic adaptor subunit [Rhizobiaceae bacterium]|nr:MAG: efflux RND transporter periplasmic adaptor subunit [Rhizobiaceae bacterium]CAG0968430.1 Macrolide export protein MacA [Rhizobiaceae bacterium]
MQQDQGNPSQAGGGSAVSTGTKALDAIIGEAAPRAGRGRRVMRWAAIALAALAVGYFVWAYLSSGTTYDYVLQKITRGDLTVVVTATGTVQPVAQVDVSTAISGIVRKVNVDYNSPVSRGDVLAELDTDTLSATVAAARARLVVAEANVAKAKAAHEASVTTYERQASLYNKGFMSAQTLQDTQLAMNANAAALKAAEAEVLVAQADLKLSETNLAKALITSPIDGVVLTRNIDEGSTVAASLQAPVLFTIAGDLRRMEVQVDVDEADIGKVAVDQEATFSVDAYPSRSFPAVITNIRFVSETINNVVTYKALLKVDNAELLLRPGMTATAEIVVDRVGAALLTPNAALLYTPPATTESGGFLGIFRPPNMGAVTTNEVPSGSRAIWVMRDKVPTEVAVETGATDGQRTQILSGGIAEGDEVIVDAVARQ